jgi:fatty acid desaturase
MGLLERNPVVGKHYYVTLAYRFRLGRFGLYSLRTRHRHLGRGVRLEKFGSIFNSRKKAQMIFWIAALAAQIVILYAAHVALFWAILLIVSTNLSALALAVRWTTLESKS